MNKIGITKEVDKLGRIVIPKDMRIMYGISESVEIIPTNEGILLRDPRYVLVKKDSKKEYNEHG